MKTASDMLLTEIKNYQDSVEIYGFESAFDNDEIIQAKTLAEAERKVLEAANGFGFNQPKGLFNEHYFRFSLAHLLGKVDELNKLREEMGLQ